MTYADEVRAAVLVEVQKLPRDSWQDILVTPTRGRDSNGEFDTLSCERGPHTLTIASTGVVSSDAKTILDWWESKAQYPLIIG